MSEIDLCKGDCLEVGKEIFFSDDKNFKNHHKCVLVEIFTIEDEEHYYCECGHYCYARNKIENTGVEKGLL